MPHPAFRAVTAVVSAAALVALAACTEPAPPWFGLALPAGLGDPHQPVVTLAGAPAPSPVPAGEEGYVHLTGARIRADTEAIVGFSKESRASGDRVWGRVTGFPASAATMAWAAEQFRAAGLSGVEVQTYDAIAPMWWARSWDVRLPGDPIFGEGSGDVVLESALPTSGSEIAGTLTAPLVFVGAVSSEDDGAGVDVSGKLAVQHLKPASGAYSERGRTVERARALMKRGAVAVINVVEQTANMHVRDFGNCGGPCFNLGTADGAFLEAAIERAAAANVAERLRIQLQLEAGMLEGLTGTNAVGFVRGRRDGNIIVNAHGDGWFDAAGDNADGLAVLVALARHFAQPENRPERTLVFVASGGHHSPGLNGPANFVRQNPALTARTVLVLNLEHIAQLEISSETWRAGPGDQPMNFGISNESPRLAEIARTGMERYGFRLNPTFSAAVPGDLGGYAPLGVPRVQAIHSGPMYHTSGDVVETISTPGLERAARFYAYFLTEAARLEVLRAP